MGDRIDPQVLAALAKRLTERADELGKSQTLVAAEMTELRREVIPDAKAIKPQTVSPWFNGKQRPSPLFCRLLETVLKLEAGSLARLVGHELPLSDEPAREPGRPVIVAEARRSYDAVQEALPRLSPLQMEVVADLVRGLQRLPSEDSSRAAPRRAAPAR